MRLREDLRRLAVSARVDVGERGKHVEGCDGGSMEAGGGVGERAHGAYGAACGRVGSEQLGEAGAQWVGLSEGAGDLEVDLVSVVRVEVEAGSGGGAGGGDRVGWWVGPPVGRVGDEELPRAGVVEVGREGLVAGDFDPVVLEGVGKDRWGCAAVGPR